MVSITGILAATVGSVARALCTQRWLTRAVLFEDTRPHSGDGRAGVPACRNAGKCAPAGLGPVAVRRRAVSCLFARLLSGPEQKL